MAITLKDFNKYKSDSSLYATLNDENKKKFWDYGTSQGLVPTHLLSDSLKAEMNKYTSGTYKPSVAEPSEESMQVIAKEEDRFAKDYIPTTTTIPKTAQEEKQSILLGADIGGKKYTSLPSTRQPYTTTPVLKKPVVPLVDQRLQNIPLANRLQNLKEESLDTQNRPIGTLFNFADRQQGTKGILTPQAQRIALEQTPTAIAGTLGGIGGAFGIKNTPEQRQYLEDTKEGYGNYYVAGNILGNVAGYGAVNAALKGTKLGATLTNVLGKKFGEKAGGYIASQGAQLLADAVVQAPTEFVEAVQNDKSIGEDVKQILLNRAIDLALNVAIQGGSDKVKTLFKNKNIVQAIENSGISKEEVETAIDSGDNTLIKQIRAKLNIQPVDAPMTVKQGIETPSLLQKARQASNVSPFGDATAPVVKPQIIQPTLKPQVEIPTAKPQIETPTLKPVEVPKVVDPSVEVTKPTLYPKEITDKLKSLEDSHKDRLDVIKKKPLDSETRAKELKAEGMKYSAEKRQIIQGDSLQRVEGGFTEKELLNKRNKEATNYAGKKVTTPDGEGVLTGKSAFGNVGVKLNDGTVKFFKDADIVSKPVPKLNPIEFKKPEVIETKPIADTKKVDVPNLTPKPLTAQLPKTPITELKPAKFVETAKKSEATVEETLKKLKTLETGSTTDKSRLEVAKKFVDDDLESALKVVRSGDKFESDIEGAVGYELYGRLQKAGRYDDAAEVIESLARKSKKSGQEIQMLSIFSKSTPEGLARWATKTLKDADLDVDQKLISEVYDDVKKINEMTPEQLVELVTKNIKNKKERQLLESFIQSEGIDTAKQYAIGQTMSKVFNRLPISSARQLSTIQAMSHLLNFRTFNRNISGNTASILLEQVAKLPASAIDRALSTITKKRTLTANAPRWQQSMNEAIRAGKKSYAEIKLGVHRGQGDKYDTFYESAFSGKGALSKLGRGLEKTLSISLQTPDEMFKGFVASDSIYNQVRARLGKEVNGWELKKILENATQKELDTAADEAKFATFQNDSFPAKMLTNIKKALNQFGYGKTLPSGMKEFGAGDLVIKYTRVPGNLIARGVEYSPIGALKALTLLGDLDKNQRQVSQVLGRALTGTGLMVLGKVLADNGLITSDKSLDKDQTYDERSLEKSEGLGGMKVNLSALKRLVSGGSTEKQVGDKYVSYDWLQPVNTPLAIGTKLADKKYADLNRQDLYDLISSATFEQATDLPTMFIAKQMVTEGQRGGDYLDVLSVPLLEAIPGFVPSIIRQGAQAIDPVIRETKGKDRAETTKNKMISNIPVLSKTLQPQLSPTGEQKVREGGLLGAFLNPATQTTYKPNVFTPKLEEIKKLTGKANFYPDAFPPKQIQYYEKGNKDKVKSDLTPEEKTLYQQTYGNFVRDQYNQKLSKAKIETKERAELIAEVLSDIESTGRQMALNAILKKRGVRK